MSTNGLDLVFIAVLLLMNLFLQVILHTAEAGAYIEVGTGYNKNLTGCSACWNDAEAGHLGAYMRLGTEVETSSRDLSWGLHWIHLSQWFEGPPFNIKTESSVDHLGVYLRYDW